MEYEDIKVEKGTTLEIELFRPEKLNSIRERTAIEIMYAMEEAEHDRAVTAVILKGSEKAFSTGVDTSEFKMEPGSEFDVYRTRKRIRKTMMMQRFVLAYTKPVISAIEGFALGGGLELALSGDIIVCGENARLGLPEARLGMMPGAGGTQTLPRRIGASLAKELMWTGRRLNAEEAKACGLANHVVPAGQAVEKARAIVAEMANSAPLSLMLIKQAVDRGLDMSMLDGLATEGDISYLLTFTKDREEGLKAFREKRSPMFKGE